jgi:hypothetical protein
VKRLAIDIAPGEYTVARLPKDTPLPEFTLDEPALVSVTSTPTEVSVVCPSAVAPESENAHDGWRLLTVRGPLEFSLTGIMAAIAGALAAAGVSLFAVSTFDTDHVLVKDTDLDRAVAALREAGHEVGPA